MASDMLKKAERQEAMRLSIKNLESELEKMKVSQLAPQMMYPPPHILYQMMMGGAQTPGGGQQQAPFNPFFPQMSYGFQPPIQ